MASDESAALISQLQKACDAEAFTGALKDFLGPALTKPQSTGETRKSLAALAESRLSFINSMIKQCIGGLSSASPSSPPSPLSSSQRQHDRVLALSCSICLVALERLLPVLKGTSSFDLDKYWARLASKCSDKGLVSHGVTVLGRVSHSITHNNNDEQREEALEVISRLRASLSKTVGAAATSEKSRKPSQVLLPGPRETHDVAKLVASVLFHEVQCVLSAPPSSQSGGGWARALAVLDREFIPWLLALEKLDESSTQQYAMAASHSVQKAVVGGVGSSRPDGVRTTAEGRALAGVAVRLLAIGVKRSTQKFITEASRCLLVANTAEDAASHGIACMLLTEEARKSNVIPPSPQAEVGCAVEYSEWCQRLSSALVKAGDKVCAAAAKETLSECIEFLSELPRGDDGVIGTQLALCHLAFAVVLLSCAGKGNGATGAAEIQLRAASVLLGDHLETLSYAQLYRATKALDDIKRAAVQNWSQLSQQSSSSPGSTVAVPNPLLREFGRAMATLAKCIARGLAVELSGDCAEATAKRKFRAVQNYRTDALQCAVQAFYAAGDDGALDSLMDTAPTLFLESEREADKTESPSSRSSSSSMRRLAGVYYNLGVMFYNDKRYDRAAAPLGKCCELLETHCTAEEQKQSGLQKKLEFAAICRQRTGDDPECAVDALAKSAGHAVGVLREKVPQSVVQRFVHLCSTSFPESPEMATRIAERVRTCGGGASELASLVEQQLSVMQSRCAPVAHQFALLGYAADVFRASSDSVVFLARCLVEQAKLARESSGNGNLSEACGFLSEAIDALKTQPSEGSKQTGLGELAIAYAWNGIVLFESKRASFSECQSSLSKLDDVGISAMSEDVAEALRPLHYSLGVWSLAPTPSSSAASFTASLSGTLQVLQCTVDLLAIIGDLTSQANACIIAERVSDLFSRRDERIAEDAAVTAVTTARLSLARAYGGMELHDRAAEVLARAECGVSDYLAKQQPTPDSNGEGNCGGEESVVADADSTDNAALEAAERLAAKLRALICSERLLHATASASPSSSTELSEAERILGEVAVGTTTSTWEEVALAAELEYAIAEALFHSGKSGKALDLSTSALRRRHTVAAALFPGITSASDAPAAPPSALMSSRALFSEWRVLDGLLASLLQVGWIHETRESIHEAHYFYTRGATIGLALRVPRIVALFKQELGELEYRRGDFSASTSHFKVAGAAMRELERATKLQLPRKEQVLSVMRLGDLHRRMGKSEDARAAYIEAAALCNVPQTQVDGGNGDTAIEVIARRGDQTPREARILGLSAKAARKTAFGKPSRRSPLTVAAAPTSAGGKRHTGERQTPGPMESLAARIEGKLARLAMADGETKRAEDLLTAALERHSSPVVTAVLNLRMAQLLSADSVIRSAALEYAARARETAVAFGVPSLLRESAMAMLAASLPPDGVPDDPWKVAHFLNSGLGVPVCQQVTLLEQSRADAVASSSPSVQPDELDELGRQIGEMSLDDNVAHTPASKDATAERWVPSLFDMSHEENERVFRERYVDCLPPNWTVVSLAAESRSTLEPSVSPSLVVCRLQAHREPLFARTTDADLTQALREMCSLMEENRTTASATAKTDDQRASWWSGRASLDVRVRGLLGRLEDTALGWAKALALGPFSDDAVRVAIESKATELCKKRLRTADSRAVYAAEVAIAAVPFLDRKQTISCAEFVIRHTNVDPTPEAAAAVAGEMEAMFKSAIAATDRSLPPTAAVLPLGKEVDRHPVILVLDKTIQELPWESTPCLSGFAVSRVPSLAFVSSLASSEARLPFVEPEKAFYIVDPAANLPKTASAMRPLIESHPGWRGTISGSPPDPPELLTALEGSDLLLYCGHGSGEQYLPGHELSALKRCPAVLLMGCSSAALKPQGEYEPTGAPVHWLSAGGPAVVGNLWDVTDGDLDLLTQALFNEWFSPSCTRSATLPGALAGARRACKLKSLVGAAAVCFGVPLACRTAAAVRRGSKRQNSPRIASCMTATVAAESPNREESPPPPPPPIESEESIEEEKKDVAAEEKPKRSSRQRTAEKAPSARSKRVPAKKEVTKRSSSKGEEEESDDLPKTTTTKATATRRRIKKEESSSSSSEETDEDEEVEDEKPKPTRSTTRRTRTTSRH